MLYCGCSIQNPILGQGGRDMGFPSSFFKALSSDSKKLTKAQPQKSYVKEVPKEENEVTRSGLPIGYYDDVDFENRFLRARTEPLEIVEFCNEQHNAAKIRNNDNNHVYAVSLSNCECEDYIKYHAPCKHMLFLALQIKRLSWYEKPVPYFVPKKNPSNGRFIPYYWKYYTGRPNGPGYTNLFVYSVTGRVHGISGKTGRPTNRKKQVLVNAKDSEDARTAAQEIGVVAPYQVTFIDMPPSYNQYSYVRSAGIPRPNIVSDADISALLTRCEDYDDEICPPVLFQIATQHRARVSYFASPNSVISCIWNAATEKQKPVLFCYAVYCREFGFRFGEAPIENTDLMFLSYSPAEKQLKYILSIVEFGWRFKKISKSVLAYQSAIAHIKKTKPFLFGK